MSMRPFMMPLVLLVGGGNLEFREPPVIRSNNVPIPMQKHTVEKEVIHMKKVSERRACVGVDKG